MPIFPTKTPPTYFIFAYNTKCIFSSHSISRLQLKGQPIGPNTDLFVEINIAFSWITRLAYSE
ncbi:hypothetical protein EG68_12600 [Paragonimus skrjabini miyazakii]|uniref:Uncharacterized protein n=1 Tax=Paragonimus skrjabini miyazakii TaxID=59628 RepID=A0A8S9YC50_9TREM|nr:hypothetical protein EG68_12600 [Paragonimus skrjabini miyazakii]